VVAPQRQATIRRALLEVFTDEPAAASMQTASAMRA
jgi:hypothetical protein